MLPLNGVYPQMVCPMLKVLSCMFTPVGVSWPTSTAFRYSLRVVPSQVTTRCCHAPRRSLTPLRYKLVAGNISPIEVELSHRLVCPLLPEPQASTPVLVVTDVFNFTHASAVKA